MAGTTSANELTLYEQTRRLIRCSPSRLASAVPLVAAPPQIAQFDPLALRRENGRIHDPRTKSPRCRAVLWTTFAARCEFVPADDESSQKGEKLVCRVTVPRDEQVGIGAMRVVTGEGVSNPVLVMLDDLPTVAETSDNHTTEQAQPIQWPIAVDGQCDPVQEDLFRFHAAAGQRVSFEVVSQRLGSKLDPVLRLLTADGKEVVRLDDAEGSGGDSRFAHTFESDGDYLLALATCGTPAAASIDTGCAWDRFRWSRPFIRLAGGVARSCRSNWQGTKPTPLDSCMSHCPIHVTRGA